MCKAQAAQMNETVEVEEPTKCSARGAHTLPPQAVQVLCKKSVHKALTLGRDKMLIVYMLDLTKSQVKPGKREMGVKSINAHCFEGELIMQHSW